MHAGGDESAEADVAALIATDRDQQIFEASSLIPVMYDFQRPYGTSSSSTAAPKQAEDEIAEQPRHLMQVVHKKTGATRQLATFKKPLSSVGQDRLRSFLSSLQRASGGTESIVKVLEVFEDYMDVHLVLEDCTGGTAYERIINRHYFTEQEAAVIVRHMLHSILALHEQAKMYHGCLGPDSFRFLADAPQAPLKMTDFGIELKVHRWDAAERRRMSSITGADAGGGGGNPTPPKLQVRNWPVQAFYETWKLVFVAPEFAPRDQTGPCRRQNLLCDSRRMDNLYEEDEDHEQIDEQALAKELEEHADWCQQESTGRASASHKRLEQADVWSLGAIAYLLLCGYPPFFAPSRSAILDRVQQSEVAFDPPFWSKITEEAKSFCSECLVRLCEGRLTLRGALEHPWIKGLADTSPQGAMFTSFLPNLSRFHRTAIVETLAANMLATRLKREDMHSFLRRCREIDMYGAGFFTASDLKHVLSAMGHADVAEAVAARFLHTFRHPAESYVDYTALLDSVFLRQRRQFEESLWRNFIRASQSRGRDSEQDGELALDDLNDVLSDPVIIGLLREDFLEGLVCVEEATLQRFLENSIKEYCATCGAKRVNFHQLCALLLRFVRMYVDDARPGAWSAQGGPKGESPGSDRANPAGGSTSLPSSSRVQIQAVAQNDALSRYTL
eukprot:TRINITY_DN43445_c0_g1_i1.p1 TRINITY_DN43445_c0_g1~~TRINITY_DN43445_c0_g1_i1.p1  ORF type:complete len:757 (+),score=125.59 TRINITY_DN43445_c0_g1_i1:255-2273(+)